ncbi:unnamed protein product [Rotaria magnacalcarata]|uniref:Major facilitator superfamily (MFS) profile domain-containing protein n=3 Tax=Rotaria magnacalcarata TaxID=392030 RepID=A0A816ZPE4_9BILA|nr:unnamed protein product [Rotaria magnacalcarata]CAF1205493.1 unnamed protein product [Rotaria magnacalcarata]CAF1927995.1 unnamed protein product [Rotaria magnacalcarata]CAF2138242.1 unnamed protein product [Rotaria magnacalcarata]CAF2206152.1 unnamed protein product [Rotaria magnacalcarata]
MKFDTFLATVNDWGRFQKVKYALICLTYMLPPIMVYTYTFTGAVPNFRCANPDSIDTDEYNNESNILYDAMYKPTKEQCTGIGTLLSVVECQRCYIQSKSNNQDSVDVQLHKCQNYVYDRKYYKKTLTEEWSMVCDRTYFRSLAQIIFFVGYMVGSVVFGVLADKYGRRPVMSFSFILMSVSGFVTAFGPQPIFGVFPSYIIFVVARFLLACSTRGISVSGFVLGSEIVGPSKRLLTGIVIEYFFAFGQFFLLFFAYSIRTWRLLTGAISLFTVPFIFFYFILPESPRWLISNGQFDRAEAILRGIAKTNKRPFDQDAYEQVKEEQKVSMMDKHNQEGILGLFKSKIMFLISMNLFFQWLVQNLVFYGVSQNTGSWGFDPYLSFMLSATVELLAYILVHCILDRVGRKLPYCLFAILFGLVALAVLPIQKFMNDNSFAKTMLMYAIQVSLKFFASATYAIIYIYANELFPTNVRNTGMGICSMVARIGAIIGTYCNDSLARIWINLPVLLYGIVSLIAAVLALMFPETLNKPLPQTVAEAERMSMIRIRIGKPQSTNTDGTEREDQSLAGNNEDSTLKDLLQGDNIDDRHL